MCLGEEIMKQSIWIQWQTGGTNKPLDLKKGPKCKNAAFRLRLNPRMFIIAFLFHPFPFCSTPSGSGSEEPVRSQMKSVVLVQLEIFNGQTATSALQSTHRGAGGVNVNTDPSLI